MRVVLDTNVLVAGLLSAGGGCGQILELCVDGVLRVCIDGRILAEHEDVLRRSKLAIPLTDANVVLALLCDSADVVAARPLPVELPDPDDMPFLEVAATAWAPLCTGNAKHYPPDCRPGVTVLSPADLLDVLRRRGS